MMMVNRDWKGRDIKGNESPDAVVKVWEIEPALHGDSVDSVRERSWQGTLRYVSSYMDIFLERFSEEELADGVSVTFRLVEMRKSDYDELAEDPQ